MTRLIAARFSNCAVSICFWTILVNAKITGINTTRSSASPRFWNQITAKILMTLQASANMLMIPEVNNASTVSTSPTNLDTTAPGSSLFNVSALSRTSFFESSLRNAWVIFCPNTVRKLSLKDSSAPDKRISRKYSAAMENPGKFPPAIWSMIFPRTRGGSREMTTAPVTVRMIPMESHFSCTTVFPIIDAALIRLFAVMISISSPQNFHAVSLMDSRDFRFFSLSIQYPHISVRRQDDLFLT